MKLLVTGGAGFIGSNFVQYWLKKYPKDKILVLDKFTYAGNKENLAGLPMTRLTIVKGDISNKKLVDKLMKTTDLVVHFAAESHVDRSVLGPEEFVKSNVWGTFVLLEAARKYNTRFHHVSTDEVFGSLDRKSTDKFNEETRYDPRSPYSASKAGSDHLVRAWNITYGLKTTITNCSNNYGPYHYPEKFIPLSITNILEGKKVPIYGDGGQSRDWLYVLDHCRAIDLVIKKGKIGETYLVGGRLKEITNLELVRMLVKLMGKQNDEVIEWVKDRPGHDQKYVVDWRKIKKLGWKPTVTLREGLKRTIEWYVKNQSWWKKIKNKKFINYYQKQYGGKSK